MDERLAMTLVTGFLGSGKTTLIRRYLETLAGAGTGLIVNEYGQEAVDHSLLVHAAEQVELVAGGCICCARRNDVAEAMYRLVQMSLNEGRFERAILETSGLADPAPIIATLDRDPWLKSHVRLASVVTVFDAVAGIRTVEEQPEARRQLSIADTVIVTKMDMRDAEDFDVILKCILSISPDARVVDSQNEHFRAEDYLGGTGHPALNTQAPISTFQAAHSGDVSSFTLRFGEKIDWPAFTVWLSALLHAHGDQILRVKGILSTSSSETPLAIHGVQHVMHPPSHIANSDEPIDPYLVFITRGIAREAIRNSLISFLDCAPEHIR